MVCFDVGGVLIRIAHTWQEATQFASVAIAQELKSPAFLSETPFFLSYQQGTINDDEYLAELAAFLGLEGIAAACSVHNHIMIEPYPRVDEIVRSLNHIGITTACLSNTNQPHWDDMFHSGRFPANEAIQFRRASHLMKLQKPDPEIFVRFASEVGAHAGEILLFDDSSANIESASQLGWRTYKIDPHQSTYEQMVAGLAREGLELGHLPKLELKTTR